MRFIFFLIMLSPICWTQFIGPVDLTLERVEKCDEDRLGVVFKYTMQKLNRTHFGIDAYLRVPFDVDDTVSGNFTAYKWGDGGWKPNIMDTYDSNACNLLMKYGKDRLEEIMEMVNHPTKSCPIKKGQYNLTNFVFGNDFSVPFMYGKFKAEIRFNKNDVTIACLRAFVKVDPKKAKIK